MKQPKPHIIRIASFIIVAGSVILLLVSDRVQLQFLEAIKRSLDFEPTYKIVIAISLITGLFYSFYYARHSRPDHISQFLKIFGPLIDPPLNTLAYGLVIASVLRLFRGLFNQIFFEIEYFKDFGFINVSAVALACIPLLIWSISGLFRYAKPLFGTMDQTFGKITPIMNDEPESNDTIE